MSGGGHVLIVFGTRPEAIKLAPTEISKRHWPCFYDGPNVKKFIIPIRPVYHDRLFVELKEQVSELIWMIAPNLLPSVSGTPK
jgi:hypothetical protein